MNTLDPEFSNISEIDNAATVTALVDHTDILLFCSDDWEKAFQTSAGQTLLALEPFQKNSKSFLNALSKAKKGKNSFVEEKVSNHYRYRWNFIPSSNNAVFIQRSLLDAANIKRHVELRDHAAKVAGVGYWEVDLVEGTLFWSEVTRQIHKVPADFEPDLDAGINFYKEGYYRDRIATLVENAITNRKSWDEDLILIDSQGEEVWVNAKGRAEFEEDTCVRLLGTFQDISERVRRNILIKENEERFRSAFSNTLVGFMILDAKTLIISQANRAAEGIFGYDHLELNQKHITNILYPKDKIFGYRQILKLLSQEIEEVQFEKRFVKKDGTVVYAVAYLTLRFDEQKNPLDLIVQVRDVTELKKKNEDISRFVDMTSKQNKRLLNFAHIVSHNLRSHTSNIAMLLNFMDIEDDEEEKEQQFKMLKNASDMLGETISHLNEVIALDIDVEDKKDINLHEAINRIVDSSQGLIAQHEFEIYNNIPQDMIVPIVPAYLDSIVLNMLTNGIKYSSNERVSWLKFSAEKKEGQITIFIEDNGLGIDLERHGEKIFGMYKTFHDHPEAKGMGLFLTKNQVEIMGGSIEVSSEINKGTTFKIILNEDN